MEISGYNPASNVIFSRNASDIVFGGIGVQDPVDVTVRRNGETAASFRHIPINGSVTLHLKEILQALKCSVLPVVNPDDGVLTFPLDFIEIEAGVAEETAVWGRYVIDGGIGAGFAGETDKFLEGNWLTWRTPETRTCLDGAEFLACVTGVASGAHAVLRQDMYAVLCMEDEIPQPFRLCSIEAGDTPQMTVVDVSCRRMVAVAEENGFSGRRIVSYDVYGQNMFPPGMSGDNLTVRRFVPDDGGCTGCFLYRNSLGGLDTLYSCGKMSGGVEHETRLFIARGCETELENLSYDTCSVASGYIATRREATRWAEFLKSDTRYRYADGRLKKIIIDEADEDDVLDGLGSVTFSYHLAERRDGLFYDDERLTPVGKATLTVVTVPEDALVLLDGEPVRSKTVMPGTAVHVHVSKKGYVDHDEDVVVTVERILKVEIPVEILSVEPVELEWTVDGGEKRINVTSNWEWELKING